MSLRTTVLAQQSQIRELQSADHRRQTMITEMLVVDHRRQKQLTEAMRLIKRLLTQMTEFERQTVGNEIFYAITWTEMKNKMIDKYCPMTKIKKLEVELWELKMKESDKIEKYDDGLPDIIHGSVVASKPKTIQEATEMAIEVMDKRIHTFADIQIENKRNTDNNQQPQQHQNKRQNTGRAYAAGTIEKKPYGGSKPLCSK
ncbi:hypothetical protein Tco_0990089 [Tanacetum coccineum]|uniref:Reverse transcriptase domain-containing protein n=1 Tax=Tanacetum coccineum TaxID=301880 RepID=A0ABQ5EWL2_9ASTR